MKPYKTQGQFEVIDSFAIRNRNEFYLIGRMKEGTVKANWFVTIPFNRSMGVTIRIQSIEEVEFPGDKGKYELIIIKDESENETIDFLLGMNIGSELLDITIDGKD